MFNVDEIIMTHLLNQGCVLHFNSNICYVTAPDGSTWDFTVPIKKSEKSGMGFQIGSGKMLDDLEVSSNGF